MDALKRNPELRSTRLKLIEVLQETNQTDLIQEHRDILDQQQKRDAAAEEAAAAAAGPKPEVPQPKPNE